MTRDDQQVPLGRDRKIAFTRYHEFMARPPKRAVPAESLVALDITQRMRLRHPQGIDATDKKLLAAEDLIIVPKK